MSKISIPALLVCINQSGDIAFKASDEAVGALIRFWEKKSEPRINTNKHESPQRHRDTEANDNSR